MKFPVSWLHDFGLDVSPEMLAERLTQLGLEVEHVSPVAPAFSGVVIGEIIRAERHPNADRLQVCEVSRGPDLPLLSIVCGAPNARPGIRVCVAQIGAVLPGDFHIKAAQLRGVPSSGMLCSEKELGLPETQSGIMELPADAPLGQDIRTYLDLNDCIVEVDLTANRGDCLSVWGIARELSAVLGMPVTAPSAGDIQMNSISSLVSPDAQKACPVYLLTLIEGVNGETLASEVMRRRLSRAGFSSKNLLIDVTNDALLGLGQPMHMFDADQVKGSIQVRFAHEGESLTLLDEKIIQLSPRDLVIADQEGPIALAGVMGGLRTAVSTQTRRVLLEAAHFDPIVLAGRARAHGLHTESSRRFERGVGRHLPSIATREVIAKLKNTFSDLKVLSTQQCEQPGAQDPIWIDLFPAEVSKILGFEIFSEKIQSLLESIACEVHAIPSTEVQAIPVTVEASALLRVKVPPYRFDLRISRDLVEEVARLMGYDAIPARVPAQLKWNRSPVFSRVSLRQIKHALMDRGCSEVITYSFIDPMLHKQLFKTDPLWVLANPLSTELSVMRESVLPGLYQTAQYNFARQQHRLRIFEAARCWTAHGEEDRLGILMSGPVLPDVWRNQAISDFFVMKGELDVLLTRCGVQGVSYRSAEVPHYAHPGQSATLWHRETETGHEHQIGVIARLHPTHEAKMQAKHPVFFVELRIDALMKRSMSGLQAVSKFPAITRDLALLTPKSVPAAQLISVIRAFAGPHIVSVDIFDVYQGPHLKDELKSIAVRLLFQTTSGTLLEEEVESTLHTVLSELEKQCGACLRGG